MADQAPVTPSAAGTIDVGGDLTVNRFGFSLRRRLDQIPLYQFHRPDPRVPLEESVGALVPIQDLGRNAALREVAAHHRANERRVVLAWLLARSPAILPIPGTGTVAHLEDSIAAAGLRLSQDEVDALSTGAGPSGAAR